MSRHRRTPETGIGRVLGAAVAVLAAVVLLGSVHGTFAFWTDDASMQSGGFTGGTLDLTLDGNLAGSVNNGATWTQSTFALDAMLPGESRAVAFDVRNAGTSGLSYAVSGSATGALSAALRFSVYAGGVATNAGTAAAGNRAGSCAGTALATDLTLTASSALLVQARRPLASGATERICLVVRLDISAPNSMQGATAAAVVAFSGRQIGV